MLSACKNTLQTIHFARFKLFREYTGIFYTSNSKNENANKNNGLIGCVCIIWI